MSGRTSKTTTPISQENTESKLSSVSEPEIINVSEANLPKKLKPQVEAKYQSPVDIGNAHLYYHDDEDVRYEDLVFKSKRAGLFNLLSHLLEKLQLFPQTIFCETFQL